MIVFISPKTDFVHPQQYDILEMCHYKCVTCGRVQSDNILVIDYIKSREKGGRPDISNAWVYCSKCYIAIPITDFTDKQKAKIVKRDRYRCKRCGDIQDDNRLYVDYIQRSGDGGEPKLLNGETLCSFCYHEKHHFYDDDPTNVEWLAMKLSEQGMYLENQAQTDFFEAVLYMIKDGLAIFDDPAASDFTQN